MKWREGDECIIFIFCWVVLVFTFLCVAKAKHPRYMLPLYPALSIIIAALIDDTLKGSAIRPSWLHRSVCWVIFIMTGLVALVPVYFLNYSWMGIFISFLIIVILLTIFYFFRQKNSQVNLSFAMCVLITIIGCGLYVHCVTVHSRYKTFGTKLTYIIKKELGDVNTYNICGYDLRPSLWNIVNLNLKMDVLMIKSTQELANFMNAPGCQPLCIMEKNIFEKIKDHVLDDTLNTLDVCTKKRQVTLIFRRNNQKMYQQ